MQPFDMNAYMQVPQSAPSRLILSVAGSTAHQLFAQSLVSCVWGLGCASVAPALCAVVGETLFQVSCFSLVLPRLSTAV